MLELPSVTLCAVFTVAHELTLRAVADCTRVANFGAVRLFTDRPLQWTGPSHGVDRKCVQAGPFADLAEAGRFTTYTVPEHIETSHALFIHWDSWILDPSAWRLEFLEYDLIAAPWYWHMEGFRVGNSGFCLRSKRLIDFLAANETEFPVGDPEDLTLCRDYRPRLENLGFRWAPEALAYEFSFERSRIAKKSLGFHGAFNFPQIMTDVEIEDRLAGAPAYVTESAHYKEMRAILDQRRRREALPASA